MVQHRSVTRYFKRGVDTTTAEVLRLYSGIHKSLPSPVLLLPRLYQLPCENCPDSKTIYHDRTHIFSKSVGALIAVEIHRFARTAFPEDYPPSVHQIRKHTR